MMLDQKRLRELIMDKFDADGLRVLCFDLMIDYDDLPGESKSSKVVGLINYHIQHESIFELLDALKRLRPRRAKDWNAVIHLPKTLTIHTSVLIQHLVSQDGYAKSLMKKIRDVEDQICYDFLGKIQGDYSSSIPEDMLNNWFKEFDSLLRPVDGILEPFHVTALSCCPVAEHVFIAVAYHTKEKIIISQSSILNGPAILPYLSGTMGITIHNAVSAFPVI